MVENNKNGLEPFSGGAMKIFMSGVAHDTRSALGGVGGFAQMIDTYIKNLLERDPDEVSKQILEHMSESSDKIKASAELVARIVNGAVSQFLPETFDLSIEVARLFRSHKADFEGIEVKRDLQVTVGVLFPPTSLERILANLVENAIEAMEKQGTKKRFLEISTKLHGEKVVQLILANPGVVEGVEEIDSVFEIGNSNKEEVHPEVSKFKGHGFGLAYVRWLIETFGGKIKCESENNKVSFIITLPIVPLVVEDSPT